jgi:protein-disulfide isomerase-like protein with CxxC motif
MNTENFEGNRKVVYYYMNGCGHCNSFSPIWDEFTQTSPIPTSKIESANIEEATMTRYGITGFPTILLLDGNGNKLQELQDRTLAGLNALVS